MKGTGWLSNKVKDEKKKNKIVIIVGIIEILALVFFGLTQKWGWDEGYHTCINHFCNDLIPNYDLNNIKLSCYNYTGINLSNVYCEGKSCYP